MKSHRNLCLVQYYIQCTHSPLVTSCSRGVCTIISTHLHQTFSPGVRNFRVERVQILEDGISAVKSWMLHNRLKLNDSKIEVSTLKSRHNIASTNYRYNVKHGTLKSILAKTKVMVFCNRGKLLNTLIF